VRQSDEQQVLGGGVRRERLCIAGSGENCDVNDAQLNRINVLYHEALGGQSDADNIANRTRGKLKLGQKPPQKG
jgi:hypothetical protein